MTECCGSGRCPDCPENKQDVITPMIDSLLALRAQAREIQVHTDLGVAAIDMLIKKLDDAIGLVRAVS